MLSYHGRAYANLNSNCTSHPLVAYVNWSFDINNHISENRLENILRNYTPDYRPIYRRLFNEVPNEIFRDFVESHNITRRTLRNTYNTFLASTTTRINPLAI